MNKISVLAGVCLTAIVFGSMLAPPSTSPNVDGDHDVCAEAETDEEYKMCTNGWDTDAGEESQ